MRVLIVYASREGQTARIALRIARRLAKHGLPTDTYSVSTSPAGEVSVDLYDAVIFGSSVHFGQHDRSIAWCVTRFKRYLRRIPTAFFSVSLGIASQNLDNRREAVSLAREFVESLPWKVTLAKCFAGAIRYSRYGWLKRLMMHWIAQQEGFESDHDREFTDWDAVDRFADEFASLARGEPVTDDTEAIREAEPVS